MHSRWAMLGVTSMLLRDDAFSLSPAAATAQLAVACFSAAELLRLWAERRAARRQAGTPAALAAEQQQEHTTSAAAGGDNDDDGSDDNDDCSTVYPGESFDVLHLCSPHHLEDAVYSSWVAGGSGGFWLGGLFWAQPGPAAAAQERRLKGAEIGAGRLAMCASRCRPRHTRALRACVHAQRRFALTPLPFLKLVVRAGWRASAASWRKCSLARGPSRACAATWQTPRTTRWRTPRRRRQRRSSMRHHHVFRRRCSVRRR
jgi:hypothetical protein